MSDIQEQRQAAIRDKEEAFRRLHWHLSRAAAAMANAGIQTNLGEWVDAEIRGICRARKDWDDAHARFWTLLPVACPSGGYTVGT